MAQEKGKGGNGAAEVAPPKRCFVITPIGDEGSPERRHADWVFHIAIEPVFTPRGFTVGRADLIPHAGMISDVMFDNILNADVCVADLSHLNANVFYELGVRHMAQKPVIHIIERSFRVPFDNKDHNTIPFVRDDYHSMIALRSDIDRQLTAIEAPGYKTSNPVSIYKELADLRASGDPKDRRIAELEKQLSARAEGLSHSADSPRIRWTRDRSTPVKSSNSFRRMNELLELLERSSNGGTRRLVLDTSAARHAMNDDLLSANERAMLLARIDAGAAIANQDEIAALIEDNSAF